MKTKRTIAPRLPKHGKQSADDRRKISKRFIIHARKELKAGNRLQAGEKVWGAGSQYLKVIGEQRGWPHSSHANLRDIGYQIVAEYNGEPGVSEVSEALSKAYFTGHNNFYENLYPVEDIAVAIDVMEEALPHLDKITSSPPRPFTIDSNTKLKRLERLTGRNDLRLEMTDDNGFSLKEPAPVTSPKIELRNGKTVHSRACASADEPESRASSRRRGKKGGKESKPPKVNVILG